MELEVVKLSAAKRGFVLLPRRWVVERRQGWAAWFRRLARNYEPLAETLKGLHVVAFAMLMLRPLTQLMFQSP
jgi:transposase